MYQDSFIRRDYRDYVKDKTYWLCTCKALVELGIFDGDDNVRIKGLILGLAAGHYFQANINHMKRKAMSGALSDNYNSWVFTWKKMETRGRMGHRRKYTSTTDYRNRKQN